MYDGFLHYYNMYLIFNRFTNRVFTKTYNGRLARKFSNKIALFSKSRLNDKNGAFTFFKC
jgi:hypothetical protein